MTAARAGHRLDHYHHDGSLRQRRLVERRTAAVGMRSKSAAVLALALALTPSAWARPGYAEGQHANFFAFAAFAPCAAASGLPVIATTTERGRMRKLETTVSDVSGLISSLADTAISRIVVAAGHYALSAQLSITRSVTVEAAVPGTVVLDAQAEQAGTDRRVLYVSPASWDVVQIIGLNLTGGSTTMYYSGSGIVITSGIVTLSQVNIYSNRGLASGVGVAAMGGTLTMDRCNIHNNEQVFTPSSPSYISAYAIFIDQRVGVGAVTMTSTSVYSNDGGIMAGGLVGSKTGGTVAMTSCFVYSNNGTGVQINSGSVIMTSCSVYSNLARNGAGDADKSGGIFVNSGTLEMSDSSVYSNIALNSFSGGVQFLSTETTASLRSCQIHSNLSPNGPPNGNNLVVEAGSSVCLADTTIPTYFALGTVSTCPSLPLPPTPPPSPSSPVPPLAQPPPYPPVTHELVLVVTAGGSVEQYTDAVRAAIKTKAASELNVAERFVSVSVAAGSVKITLTIRYESAAAAAAGQAALAQRVALAADASAFLTTPALSVFVERVDLAPTMVGAGDDPYAARAGGAVVSGVVGGIASACLVAGALLFLLHRKRRARAEAAKAEKEATPVRATCESEAAQNECSFWWVNAKALRESKDVTLPRFQELSKREGFLEKQKITRQSSVQGAYTANFLTISHRWLGGDKQPPDPSGTQLDAIRSYLLAHLDIEWVWFDYWCMPQAKRSLAEDIEFKHMLKHANMLYLGTRVLILLDLSYLSRFWTLFEAWLSMQAAHPEGLTPATREQQRFDIVPIHGANRITGESLKSMWAEKTPTEAYDLLKEPDVSVTNQGDKDIQLEKLLQLDKEVCKAMRASGKVMIDVETTESSEQPIEPNRPYGVQVSNRTGNGSGVWSTHEA